MQRSILTVTVRRFLQATLVPPVEEQDLLAVEEPLQITIGGSDLAITMRTPGDDIELAAGFLLTEGIIRQASDVVSFKSERNKVLIELSPAAQGERQGGERNFYITSSCGVCGKASIEALEQAGCTTLPTDGPKVTKALINSLPARLKASQAVFNRTGGLHASGLFSANGDLVATREDVGRHNAVDKLVGLALLNKQLPLHDYILMVSGRTSFELLQKAVMAGIPILAAVGAPSSLAVKTALRFGVTLIGFLREDRFNVYSVPGRIL